jgi:hypothetical protein
MSASGAEAVSVSLRSPHNRLQLKFAAIRFWVVISVSFRLVNTCNIAVVGE